MTQNTRGLYLGSVGVGTTSPYRQVQAIAIVDENGDQVSSFGGAGVGGGLTDTQLRASPVPVAPNVQLGSGVITATTTRVTLATDGPTVSSLASIDGKTPALINDRAGVEPLGRPGVARQLTAGSASTNTALTSTCRRISIFARTSDIRYAIGSSSQTATSSSHYIAIGERLDLAVPATPNIAVIRIGSADGTLEVTEFV